MGIGRQAMNVEIKVNLDVNQIINKYGLGANKEAQRFLASEVERLCQPYVPMSAGSGGHLVNSARVYDDKIVWPGPYAHYQYYGEVMAGRAPKHYTGKPIEYHGAPMRGKEWDKRMMADRKDDICREVENYILSRG